MSGTFYIVPTPIGNLEDITIRAIRVLKESDIVFCEDTSVTQKLFKTYDIHTKTSVFHAQSGGGDFDRVISSLRDGLTVSLVSDAGTPTISDPGVSIISRIYKELPEAKVIALPGPNALTTALSVSGISSAYVTFYGFLPQKKGRETVFTKIKESDHTAVFYESVHRIEKTLESLSQKIENERMVVVCRELTKLFEEVIRGSASEVKAYFDTNKDKIKGEFVVIVEGV
ncbi:MAG: uroporphyrin-III C/tetrapyrrole (Corrin/Porphyrin) methyltransferase, rRNA [Candidatus Parcubacteria bacterium]